MDKLHRVQEVEETVGGWCGCREGKMFDFEGGRIIRMVETRARRIVVVGGGGDDGG